MTGGGFQNQDAGPQVQAQAAKEVAPDREPESSSRQQEEAYLELQENPKTRRRSDDEYTNPTNHPLDTIIVRPTKRSKEFTGDYAKPITTATPHGDTPAIVSGDAIIARPAKRSKEFTSEYAKPITMDTPHVDTPASGSRDVALMTTNEASQSMLADTLKDTSTSWSDITSPARRTKEHSGEYAESNTTKTPVGDTPIGSSGYAESHTANEEKKKRQTSPATPPRQKKHNDLVSRDKTTYGVLVGTDTIDLTLVQGTSITFYDSSANPESGSSSM